MHGAPMTPVICVREPELSAVIVRPADALTGNPWNRPALKLAVPSASSSWFWSTFAPRLAARLRDKADVSASVTKAMPKAARASVPTS